MMSDMLSQEEIDALLKGSSTPTDRVVEDLLSDDEKDALGEIGNISMGTSATTLFTLLGQKVNITTPKVSMLTIAELQEQYPIPFVAVEVKYTQGLEGTNLLVLKEDDVKMITDLMMGGDGTNFIGELTELHLSAISEAMNQMIGSASTSMAEIFRKKIDISPPQAFAMNFANNTELDLFKPHDKIVKVAFRMIIGNIIDSEIMQILPIEFAKSLVSNLFESNSTSPYTESYENIQSGTSEKQSTSMNTSSYQREQVSYEQVPGYTNHRSDPPNTMSHPRSNPVNVQPVQFQSFDSYNYSNEKESINLIRDVPLEITVELGRTTRKISEVLDLAPGSVVELDRLVGEALDILVNGQAIAKGEVVVIDENYGIRVTDIINHEKKINKLK